MLLSQTHLELRHSGGGNHASDFKMTFHASFHDYIGVCQCVELFIPFIPQFHLEACRVFLKSNKRLTFLKRLIFRGFYFCSSALLIIINFLRSFYFYSAEVKLYGVQVFHL